MRRRQQKYIYMRCRGPWVGLLILPRRVVGSVVQRLPGQQPRLWLKVLMIADGRADVPSWLAWIRLLHGR